MIGGTHDREDLLEHAERQDASLRVEEIIAAVAVRDDGAVGHTSHDWTARSQSASDETPDEIEASLDRVPDPLLEDIALALPRQRAGVTTSLRSRLAEPRALVALGAHDGLTARIAERAGVEAVYHGGYALAAHHFAVPDVGLVGRAEVVDSVRRMAAATELPIIVDADTGYGSEASVWLTTRELEAAGANAVQIEDQVSPKRCGHMEGKEVIPAAEMTLKVRAAVAARRSDETLIIFPSTQTWLFARAYAELCDAVVRDRTTMSLADRFMSFDDVNDLLGLAEWRSR